MLVLVKELSAQGEEFQAVLDGSDIYTNLSAQTTDLPSIDVFRQN